MSDQFDIINNKIKKSKTPNEFLRALYWWGAEIAKENLKAAEESGDVIKQALFVKNYLAMQRKMKEIYKAEDYEKDH